MPRIRLAFIALILVALALLLFRYFHLLVLAS